MMQDILKPLEDQLTAIRTRVFETVLYNVSYDKLDQDLVEITTNDIFQVSNLRMLEISDLT